MLSALWARIQLYVYGALAVFALMTLSGLAGDFHGRTKATAAAEKKAAALLIAHLEEVGKLNAANAKLRGDHDKDVAAIVMAFSEKAASDKAINDRRISDLGAGIERLRFATVPNGRCEARAPEAGTPAAVPHEETSAELAPPVAAALWGIVSDGDDSIVQLGSLQEYTTRLYKTCSEANSP